MTSTDPTEQQVNTALQLIHQKPDQMAFLYAQAMNRLQWAEANLAAIRCLSQNPHIVPAGTLEQISFAFGRKVH